MYCGALKRPLVAAYMGVNLIYLHKIQAAGAAKIAAPAAYKFINNKTNFILYQSFEIVSV